MAIYHTQKSDLFAGDLVAPPGLSILEKFNGDIKFIWGNNEGDKVNLTRKMDASNKIELYGDVFENEIDGLKIFMNHYPRFVELAAKSGEFDVCIYGHTHEFEDKSVNNTLLLNPGEIQGLATGTAGFVILDTETRNIEKMVL